MKTWRRLWSRLPGSTAPSDAFDPTGAGPHGLWRRGCVLTLWLEDIPTRAAESLPMERLVQGLQRLYGLARSTIEAHRGEVTVPRGPCVQGSFFGQGGPRKALEAAGTLLELSGRADPDGLPGALKAGLAAGRVLLFPDPGSTRRPWFRRPRLEARHVVGAAAVLSRRLASERHRLGQSALLDEAAATGLSEARPLDLYRTSGFDGWCTLFGLYPPSFEVYRRPSFQEAYLQGLHLLYRDGRSEEAAGAFERCLAMLPGDAASKGFLEACRRGAGDLRVRGYRV